MFSREDLAAYINQNFEAAWEMVRPVPIIRIDFGNGRTSTRTLHGNVASYVCGTDGQVMDILPGIYTPAAYTAALQSPRDLARNLTLQAPEQRPAHLQEYHRGHIQRIRLAAQPRPAANGPGTREADVGKHIVERRFERAVVPGAPNFGAAQARRPRTAAELASWQPLAADTALNESQRRLQIHERLLGAGAIRPEQIKNWLYREVLQADLEDPFMGLGDDMFADIER